MAKLIIIRGKVNAGKTTTAAFLYQNLLEIADEEHIFDGKKVYGNSLRYYGKEKNIYDFIAILIINGKTVVIISAGDVALSLKRDIGNFIKSDIIICCSRTVNKEGSSYRMILDNFAEKNPIILEEWVTKDISVSKKIAKKDAVNKIFDRIFNETR